MFVVFYYHRSVPVGRWMKRPLRTSTPSSFLREVRQILLLQLVFLICVKRILVHLTSMLLVLKMSCSVDHQDL